MVERDLKVHFGSFEKDVFPRLQGKLLKVHLDPFASEVSFTYIIYLRSTYYASMNLPIIPLVNQTGEKI